MASLPGWLLVEVGDESGRPAAGIPVEFDALGATDGSPTMYVAAPETGSPFSTTWADTTTNDGRVAARVRFGTRAGQGVIMVRVPLLGLEDTAFYTVEPGAATGVAMQPVDTAVYVGSTYTLQATVVDSHGNPLQEAATLATDSDAVSLTGDRITAAAVGRAAIVGQSGSAQDTAWVSVVPAGEIAASRNGGIALFGLDGSGYQQVVPEGGFPFSGPLVWNPSGTSLLFNPDPGYVAGQRLYTVDLDGQFTRLTHDATLFAGELWGEYTRDGTWVYFGGARMDGGTIWRIHPDGTGLENVPGLPYVSGINNINPTPSPDGTRLAYVAFLGTGNNVIRILDLTSGTVDSLDVHGHTPRWAPNDDRIAYILPTPSGSRQGPVWMMRADGSQQHQISMPGRVYSFGINWSPDGQWIVAFAPDLDRLELINATTGLTLPLAYSTGFAYPAWQPGG